MVLIGNTYYLLSDDSLYVAFSSPLFFQLTLIHINLFAWNCVYLSLKKA